MRKIDNALKNIFVQATSQSLACLVYCYDFEKTKSYINNIGIKIIGEFKFINALAIDTSYDCAKKLSTQTFVKFLSAATTAFALVDISKKIIGIDKITTCTKNMNVAIIDTGISMHLDFVMPTNRIVKFIDLVNQRKAPYDDNGHGTFVAGVFAGNGLVSNQKYAGFAPQCNIIAIKALNNKGEGNAVQILSAMQWICDNCKKYNIKVVCMSFGSEPLGSLDPIMKGAEKLWSKGIIVVAAAGNSGANFQTIKSPGISGKIITVGGMNDNRANNTFKENDFEIAKFSSRGPALGRYKPDCVAPSVDIVSCGLNDFYTTLSGTSVATPMVAGICVQLLAQKSNLKPDQVKRLLLKSCKSILKNAGNKRNIEGFGYPNFNN
ncbi:MAG: S8 family peptidase [Clostridia bacterium]|nr:S8 family peptidase [Clostridia bacterium]